MSAGYVIAQLKVTNPENYKEYIKKLTDEQISQITENAKHYQENWKRYLKSVF